MFISRPTSILPVGPESKTALAMTDAGAVFLASLTTDQEAMALWPLESGERFNWDYSPIPRQGLSLKMMNSHQQKLALALLSAGLSPRGLGKALGIMALEASTDSEEDVQIKAMSVLIKTIKVCYGLVVDVEVKSLEREVKELEEEERQLAGKRGKDEIGYRIAEDPAQ